MGGGVVLVVCWRVGGAEEGLRVAESVAVGIGLAACSSSNAGGRGVRKAVGRTILELDCDRLVLALHEKPVWVLVACRGR